MEVLVGQKHRTQRWIFHCRAWLLAKQGRIVHVMHVRFFFNVCNAENRKIWPREIRRSAAQIRIWYRQSGDLIYHWADSQPTMIMSSAFSLSMFGVIEPYPHLSWICQVLCRAVLRSSSIKFHPYCFSKFPRCFHARDGETAPGPSQSWTRHDLGPRLGDNRVLPKKG
jgi:hypothetical protein